MCWAPETTLAALISSASMDVLGTKRLSWLPDSDDGEAPLAGSGSRFCSLMLASKEMLCDLPERGSKGSQPNDPSPKFTGSISRFSSACDDLAQLIEFAQHAVPVGLWLRQFGFSRRQALPCIL